MPCCYISLVPAYCYLKLNYSEYLKNKKTTNICYARLSLMISKLSDSREKTLTCVHLDKPGSFQPYIVFSSPVQSTGRAIVVTLALRSR